MTLNDLKKLGGFAYCATPYSKHPRGLRVAHFEACAVAGELIKNGVCVYSPIAHTHPIAEYAEIDPHDHSIWLPADKPMMDAAAALVVVQMDSWRVSYGIAEEIKHFRAAGKPIFYLDPETLEVSESELEGVG